MKHTILFFAITFAVLGAVVLYKQSHVQETPARFTIAIMQSASHPALDSVHASLVDTLTKEYGANVHIVSKNAEGSFINAHAIAKQFHTDRKITLFATLGTLATQALSAVESERPIVCAAVTDPYGLGLNAHACNVCGTSDNLGAEYLVNTLTTLVPQAQRIGILYTADQQNQIKEIKNLLEKHTKKVIPFAMTSETDLPALVELMCRKVDALITPIDTNVALAISLIATIALKHKKPLIVSDPMLVQSGPLAAYGVDYAANGVQTAEIITRLLEGEKPCDISFNTAAHLQLYVHKKTYSALSLQSLNSYHENICYI